MHVRPIRLPHFTGFQIFSIGSRSEAMVLQHLLLRLFLSVWAVHLRSNRIWSGTTKSSQSLFTALDCEICLSRLLEMKVEVRKGEKNDAR